MNLKQTSGRLPTAKQKELLQILANGCMVLAPGRREWGPLLRRGWVAPECEDEGKRYLPPLRITPEGLRALAGAVERDGLPEMKGGGRRAQLDEPPIVTRLKAERDDLKERLRASENWASRLEWKMQKARRELGEVER